MVGFPEWMAPIVESIRAEFAKLNPPNVELTPEPRLSWHGKKRKLTAAQKAKAFSKIVESQQF